MEMNKLIVIITILLVLPSSFCFAQNPDLPVKSATSQIRVIIPPFAVIRLSDNTLKAVPLNEVSKHLKQSTDSKVIADQNDQPAGIVESNQEFITGTESKTEKTPTSLQITNIYTSTQQ